MEEILARLERLAEDLDAQKYPGEAWPAAALPSPRRRVWRVASLIAAIAATVAVLIHFSGRRPPREECAPASQDVAVREPTSSTEDAPEEVTVPAILVVEDHDSYSFIDLMADVPLVSFAKKDAYMPECVVPLLSDAVTQLPIEEEM